MGDNDSDSTSCNAALVFKIAFEDFIEVKQYIKQLGGTIVYQKSAPPGQHLYITLDNPSEDDEGERY